METPCLYREAEPLLPASHDPHRGHGLVPKALVLTEALLEEYQILSVGDLELVGLTRTLARHAADFDIVDLETVDARQFYCS